MNQDRKALLYSQFFRKSHIEIRLHSLTRGTNHRLIGAARATAIWKVFAPPFFTIPWPLRKDWCVGPARDPIIPHVGNTDWETELP